MVARLKYIVIEYKFKSIMALKYIMLKYRYKSVIALYYIVLDYKGAMELLYIVLN